MKPSLPNIVFSVLATSLMSTSVKSLGIDDYVNKTISAGTSAPVEGVAETPTVDACRTNSRENQVECDFFFQYMAGATMWAELTMETCENMTAVNITSTDVIAAAPNTNVVTIVEPYPEFTADQKNRGEFIQKYCARADLYDDVLDVSMVSNTMEVEATFTFDDKGDFNITVSTEQFAASDAEASATRSVTLSSHFGACGAEKDAKIVPAGGVEIGSSLQICAQVNGAVDADVKISGIKSVTIKDANDSTKPVIATPVDGEYNINFVTTLTPNVNDVNDEAASSAGVTIETLMIPKIYDVGATQIVIAGIADLTYSRRRLSSSGRVLQETTTSEEAFAMMVDLKEKETIPQIAMDVNGAGKNGNAGGVGMIAFAAVAVALI